MCVVRPDVYASRAENTCEELHGGEPSETCGHWPDEGQPQQYHRAGQGLWHPPRRKPKSERLPFIGWARRPTGFAGHVPAEDTVADAPGSLCKADPSRQQGPDEGTTSYTSAACSAGAGGVAGLYLQAGALARPWRVHAGHAGPATAAPGRGVEQRDACTACSTQHGGHTSCGSGALHGGEHTAKSPDTTKPRPCWRTCPEQSRELLL